MILEENDPILQREACAWPLVFWPDPILKSYAEEVASYELESGVARELIGDMIAVMKKHHGIGLAAPQIGFLKRVIVLWINEQFHYYINPRITERNNDRMMEFPEGCLSVPGHYESRERPYSVTVQYIDIDGIHQMETIDNLHAFAMQHEIDHLNGKVFVDGLSELKRNRIRDKVKKSIRRMGTLI